MTKFRRRASLAMLALAALATTACSATGATVTVTTTVTPNLPAPVVGGGGASPSAPSPSGGGSGANASSASTLASGSATTGASGAARSSDPSAASGSAAGSTTAGTAATSSAPASTTSGTETAGSTPTTPSSTPKPKPVHVSTFEGDGKTYGVGMAVMVLFSAAPTNATAFVHAATVTVDGKPANGGWFWQRPTIPGYKMEALYREKSVWPAHSTIDVDLPVKGLSAGLGLAYEDSLSVTFHIGAAHVSHVNNAQHMMTVTSDGEVVKNFPVSLGKATTPTYDGTKVIMAKGSDVPGTHTPRPDGKVRMKSAPGEVPPYNILVPWSVRITDSGEFIHAAGWNIGNIGSHNTSHGCTNLDPEDAEWFYHFSQIGDVVDYPDANAKGTVQPSWDGWGWWNVPWSEWSEGGMLLDP